MLVSSLSFFFNDTATTEIYTLSLHDALPIWPVRLRLTGKPAAHRSGLPIPQIAQRDIDITMLERDSLGAFGHGQRSEEHTSELQSRLHLVCRLLLEKKKK